MATVQVYWNDNGTPRPFPVGDGSDGTIKTTVLNSVDRGSVLSAGTAFTVPEYELGSNNLQVYLNGLLCLAGSDKQYVEDTSTTIKFNDDIPADAEISALATIGSSYEGVLYNRVVVSESREADLAIGEQFAVPEHVVGYGRLRVFIDGLILQEGFDFAEVNSSAITFNFVLPSSSQVCVQAAVFM